MNITAGLRGFQPVTTPTIFATPSARQLNDKRGVFRMTRDGLEKRCCKCREYWPADNTGFYAGSRTTDGLYPWCKACYITWRNDWKAKRAA